MDTKPVVEKVKAELIKVLPLQEGCSYIIFIPMATGLSMEQLMYINEDIEEHHGVKATIILTKETNGIAAIEKREEKNADNSKRKTDKNNVDTRNSQPSIVGKTSKTKKPDDTQEPSNVDSGLLEV